MLRRAAAGAAALLLALPALADASADRASGLLAVDPATGSQRWLVRGDLGNHWSPEAFRPDGSLLAYHWRSGDDFLAAVAPDGLLAEERPWPVRDDEGPRYAFSRDLTRVAYESVVVGADRTVRVRVNVARVDGRARRPVFTGVSHNPPDMAFAPTGDRVAISTNDDRGARLAVRDLRGRQRRAPARLRLDGPSLGLSWSPDGRWIAIPGRDTTGLFPATGGRPRLLRGVTANVWSHDGRRLAGTAGGRAVVVVDVATGTRSSTPEIPGWVDDAAMAWSPDGSTLAAAVTRRETDTDDLLFVTAGPVARLVRTELGGSDVDGLVWAPDGRTLIAGVSPR